jgi:hypothetical protein
MNDAEKSFATRGAVGCLIGPDEPPLCRIGGLTDIGILAQFATV